MKKIILSGLLAGIVMLAVGVVLNFVFNAVFPSLVLEYENLSVFRSFDDPLMWIFIIEPFVLGVILAWIWSKTKSIIPGSSPCARGVKFGLLYLLITIPGMIMSYSSFQISIIMVVSWMVAILIQGMLAGILYAKLIK